jgi:hypothetical protein
LGIPRRRPRKIRAALATFAVGVVVTGCGSNDARSASQEVQESLRAANVADVEIEDCEAEEDPERSEFSVYRCSMVADAAVTLPGDSDRLPAGRSAYCFHVPRLPHGGGAESIDLDAYPAWVAEDDRCF